MKHHPTTIKDLARELGLSVSTVSRALRGYPDVNPETRKAVKDLAERWHYAPNNIAQSLILKHTHTIGVLIPEFIYQFYAIALSGIQEVIRADGYQALIVQTGESLQAEKESLLMLMSKRVDGLLVSLSRETDSYGHLADIIAQGVPLVLFNRVTPRLPASRVFVNDYQGGFQATRHLIEQGYERIAHIRGPLGLDLSENRFRGYKDALLSSGKPFRPEWVQVCDFTVEGGRKVMREWLAHDEQPDAIFAVCDEAAFGAMETLRYAGRSIPHEVGVIGFTDEPFARLVQPPLSSVAQPATDIGRQAARLLLDRIADPTLPAKNIELPTQLHIRGSSQRW